MLSEGGDVAAGLRSALDELRFLHERGAGGHELARRRADLLDLTLISLFRESEQSLIARGRYHEAGLAVIALGGYGRRELCPYSDVDLMLLYRPREKSRVQETAEALFYPLWDAGLELGHGARTIDDCLTLAADSLESQTALLQARLLVGDQQLFRELGEGLREQAAAGGGKAFLARLGDARDKRHAAFGHSASLLEPHLKEGRGGLRDIHELVWASLGIGGGGGVDSLIGLGWLPSTALRPLHEALETLLRARTSLHYIAGRKVDRLYRDMQDELVLLMISGHDPTGGGSASRSAAVLTEISQAALTVAFRSSDAWQVILDRVGLQSPQAPTALPSPLPGELAERRALLLELLREGERGLPRLERLSHEGVLSAWIPGWEAIRSRAQQDNLHTYTIDGHSLRCVSVAVELATTTGPDRLGAELAAQLALSSHWESLLLACLLHDLGKGLPDADHSEAGAHLAAQAAAGMGVNEETQREIAMLVREHLLLPDTATRRDLDDASLLDRLAEQVGSRRRLEMLYVLTVADSLATGPASWTPWRAALVQELFFKLLHLLEGAEEDWDEPGWGRHAEGAFPLSATTGPPVSAAPPLPAGSPAPTGPRATTSDADGEWYLVMTAATGGLEGEVRLSIRRAQVKGVQDLGVVSPAYPGLLTRLCGALAYHGMNIMTAQLQPSREGLVEMSFQVTDFFGQDITRERWHRLSDDLGLALQGRLALEHRLAERRLRYGAVPKRGIQPPAEVVLDNGASDRLTVLEVHARDRIGLLYTIARALDELLLQVSLAKVSTLRERVVDVFYVADAAGRKIHDPQHLKEIEQAVLFALRNE